MLLKEILFPKTCLGCGHWGSFICLDCEKKLVRLNKQRCLYCGEGSYLGLTHPHCIKKNGVDGVLSVFHFESVLKKIIKQIKYRLVSDSFSEFFQVISPVTVETFAEFKSIYPTCFLQPIPLHPIRLRERGFNQSEWIASFLEILFSFPVVYYLKRIKHTMAQAQLPNRNMRHLNLQGAFQVTYDEDFSQKVVIIVDDVITSGASIKEAARILKKAGVKKVFAFSIARG